VAEFNTLRPHEALGMQTPASVYAASPRRFTGLPELAYPFRDRDAIVAGNGSIRLHSRTVVISSVFAGQRLGLREVDTGVWPVSFMHFISDGGTKPANHRHPVPLESVTHLTGTNCYLCPRTGDT